MNEPHVNAAVMFGSLRFNLGADSKREVMKEVSDFKINTIAQARIETMWARKGRNNISAQGAARAEKVRQQDQFKASAKSRSRRKAARAAATAPADEGDGTYVSSEQRNEQLKRDLK